MRAFAECTAGLRRTEIKLASGCQDLALSCFCFLVVQICAMEKTLDILASLLWEALACTTNLGARVHLSSTLTSTSLWSSGLKARSGAYTTKDTCDTLSTELDKRQRVLKL